MTRIKRIAALAIAVLLLGGTLAACGQTSTVDMHNPEEVDYFSVEGDIIELAWEMIPLTAAPPTNSVLTPTASGTLVKKNQKAEIDYSNTADGYIMIKYLVNTTKKLKVRVTGPSGVNYDYNLKANSKFETFPLSDGSGKYSVGVFENIEGTKYSTVNSVQFDVKLKDEFAPFLRPNQYVSFTADSAVVKKAAELVKDAKDFTGKVSAVYNFIISNFTYDKDFAAAVSRGEHTGYLPDVDAVLAKKKGICFDYAAVMTAMLRSQNIPTRLVVGYAGTQYHAWIDVYSDSTGWVNNIIYFDGKVWKLMDPTFASSANQSASVMQYIGDGKNYSARYLY